MGFIRKATWVATGGVSGLGIKANSKKERTAKALEKQNRMMKQQVRQQKQSSHISPKATTPAPRRATKTAARASVSSSPSPIAEDIRVCPWCAETIKAAAILCRYCNNDVVPSLYNHLQEQHPQSFGLVWAEAKGIEPWPTFPLPPILDSCLAVERGTEPAEAVKDAFALVPYSYLRSQHTGSFDQVWQHVKNRKLSPTTSSPLLLAACLAVESGVTPSDAVARTFATAKGDDEA